MGAISLYRGNLHRVPDLPRRWPMPPPAISPGDFRLLLHRRSRALSSLEPLAPPPAPPGDVAAEGSKQPGREEEEEEGMGDNCCPKPSPAPETAEEDADGGAVARMEGAMVKEEEAGREEEGGMSRATGDVSLNPASTSAVVVDTRGAENGGNGVYNSVGDVGGGVKMETSSLDIVSDTEERKRDLKKKLDILNEKKHHLVQMLKQILNAEEEIKKRNSVQPPPVQASIPLQAEATIDTSSVTKLAAPRMNVEVNFGSDVGMGGESVEIGSHNTQPSHLQHMYSTSPSSASAFNRPVQGFFRQNSAGTPRASSTSTATACNMLLGSSTASPSRFAPSGPQGHTTNLPSVSISGTHYFASSPSPAASGGTSSVFRDSRLTSP